MKKALALGVASAACLAGATAATPQGTADPLEGYFGNTLVCAAGAQGNDLCHTWFERDGTLINIDPGGMHAGHYTRGPVRKDGKTPICYHYDSDKLVLPAELMRPPPGFKPPPAAGPGEGMPPPGGGVICRTKDFRSTCTRYENDAGLSTADKTKLRWSIAQRFHDGMCYPMAPNKKPGDSWYEDDDPMPSQNGLDKLFLLKGHR